MTSFQTKQGSFEKQTTKKKFGVSHRRWLKSLPENTIGSWEELEDAFRANFRGTYVRPPDADDLSHITQQPGESARKL